MLFWILFWQCLFFAAQHEDQLWQGRYQGGLHWSHGGQQRNWMVGIYVKHWPPNSTFVYCRATFIFKDNKLGVTAKGSQFNEFKSQFGADDRGFGYIKIMVIIIDVWYQDFVTMNLFSRLVMRCPRGPSLWWSPGSDPMSLSWRRPRCPLTRLWWRILFRYDVKMWALAHFLTLTWL